jgi:hypothetical protein
MTRQKKSIITITTYLDIIWLLYAQFKGESKVQVQNSAFIYRSIQRIYSLSLCECFRAARTKVLAAVYLNVNEDSSFVVLSIDL